MIRRSTLVLLTCLSALSVSAIQTKSVAQTLAPQSAPSDTIGSLKGLGIGSRGEAVRQLQRRLTESNYYSGPIDGLYGLETQRAIVALQRAAGLEDTGTLNEATWQALELGAQASPEGASGVNQAEADGLAIAPESGDLAIAQSTESKAESELPSVDEIAGVPPVEPESTGRIKPIVAIGLGSVGLMGSFGVGFFIANRNKRRAKDDKGWGNSDLDAVGADPDFVEDSAAPIAPSSALPAGAQGTQIKRQPAANSQYVDNGTASVRQNAPTFNPGYGPSYAQSGATGPLSQIDVIEGLMGELRNPDPAKRRKAIWELGQRGNSIAVQSLVDAMPNADSKEKSLLLAALSEIGIRSLRPMNRAMAIAFQDPNPEVRKNAIRDLSRVYDLVVQISHMLGHAAKDEDAEVRQTATWALDKLNHIRKAQDVDTNLRSFSGSGATPIDLLSSEASIRRSQEFR